MSPTESSENQPLVVQPEKPYERPETLVQWQAPARVFRGRSRNWFVGLFLLALILVIGLALLKQLTLMLAVIALAFALYALNRVEPKEIRYAIRTTGIKIGPREYYYHDLKWFWLVEEENRSVLHVSTYLSLPHLLVMVVPEEKKDEIEKALLKYLPYHEEKQRDYVGWVENTVDFLAKLSPG